MGAAFAERAVGRPYVERAHHDGGEARDGRHSVRCEVVDVGQAVMGLSADVRVGVTQSGLEERVHPFAREGPEAAFLNPSMVATAGFDSRPKPMVSQLKRASEELVWHTTLAQTACT